jgi:hypothetical protein
MSWETEPCPGLHGDSFYTILYENWFCTYTTVTMNIRNSFFLWRCCPTRVMASSFLMFLDPTQRRSTVGRTPLDEWSACRSDFYLTTHDTQNRQTSKFPAVFQPTISAGERPQTYALDRTATGTGICSSSINSNNNSNGANISMPTAHNLSWKVFSHSDVQQLS